MSEFDCGHGSLTKAECRPVCVYGGFWLDN